MIDNTSGLIPLGHAVLIRPYDQEKLGSGIIQMPDSYKMSNALLEQRAVVIAVGDVTWDDEPAPRAKPGDHVLVTKMAGYMAKGDDGEQYRLVNDRDIFARIVNGGV